MSDDAGASGGGGGGSLVAGASGATAASAAGTSVGPAGSASVAGSRGETLNGGSSVGGGGEATEEGGEPGAILGGAAGGPVAGAGSTGGIGVGGAAGSGGGTQTDGGSGGAASGAPGAGGVGGAPVVDPCAGAAHWSATARWSDYAKGDERAFGGFLWHCQSPAECTSYPGKSTSPGWIKDAECAGGPTDEVAACQCAAGTCCDGCYLRPRSYFCGEFVRTAQCLGSTVNQCGGATDTIDKDYWNLFCDGASAGECTRWGAHTKFSNGDCPSNTGCVEQGDQASCTACD